MNHKKQFSAALAATAVAMVLPAVAPANAQVSGAHACVTSADMKHLHAGQTRHSINAALGSSGRRESARFLVVISSPPPGVPPRKITKTIELRSYRACEPQKSYRLTFVRRTVDNQTAPFRLRERTTAVA